MCFVKMSEQIEVNFIGVGETTLIKMYLFQYWGCFVFCLLHSLIVYLSFSPSLQTVTEKHKLNVPETMTEILDVSDEEGKPTIHHTCSSRQDQTGPFSICP